ncbi:unnamed protein product [Mucor hiemalis]
MSNVNRTPQDFRRFKRTELNGLTLAMCKAIKKQLMFLQLTNNPLVILQANPTPGVLTLTQLCPVLIAIRQG